MSEFWVSQLIDVDNIEKKDCNKPETLITATKVILFKPNYWLSHIPRVYYLMPSIKILKSKLNLWYYICDYGHLLLILFSPKNFKRKTAVVNLWAAYSSLTSICPTKSIQ